ncbi:MAG: ABC transporter ATP-binding protein [Gammaproteobacteria bacterium]|nr:ABC transporter ATP-binding protein [Gammaproteobacteria bacterium]
MSNNDLLVQVENLYRYYDNRCAVENLNFELHTGEILGFLGPNGAGKTTTMHMLAGNLAPSAGRILINGVDILDEPKRAKGVIGYLPEQPPLYPDFTVDEYLDYCARLNRVPRAQVPAARASAKERCGLKDMGARLIGNLSKGFRQRVGIAQAIIHAPRVVILDEPTVGLDPIQIREIRALITELGREHGVILSTHILPEVQSVCSRVQIIHQGRLVFNDTLAGLATRMQAASLRLVCRQAPDVAAIKALPGVVGVEVLDSRQLRIGFQGEASPAEVVAAEVLRRGWGLLELTPERKSLEQIFVELTAADDNAAAAVQEQAA